MGRIARRAPTRPLDAGASRRLAAALLVHLAASGVHGLTHGLVPVDLAPWQDAVVLVTTFLGPIAGATLALGAGRLADRGDRAPARATRLGLAVFTLSLAVALGFGAYFHFVAWTPDHVHAVPAGPWRLPFQASAVAVATGNALGVAAGLWCWRRR